MLIKVCTPTPLVGGRGECKHTPPRIVAMRFVDFLFVSMFRSRRVSRVGRGRLLRLPVVAGSGAMPCDGGNGNGNPGGIVSGGKTFFWHLSDVVRWPCRCVRHRLAGSRLFQGCHLIYFILLSTSRVVIARN